MVRINEGKDQLRLCIWITGMDSMGYDFLSHNAKLYGLMIFKPAFPGTFAVMCLSSITADIASTSVNCRCPYLV